MKPFDFHSTIENFYTLGLKNAQKIECFFKVPMGILGGSRKNKEMARPVEKALLLVRTSFPLLSNSWSKFAGVGLRAETGLRAKRGSWQPGGTP